MTLSAGVHYDDAEDTLNRVKSRGHDLLTPNAVMPDISGLEPIHPTGKDMGYPDVVGVLHDAADAHGWSHPDRNLGED